MQWGIFEGVQYYVFQFQHGAIKILKKVLETLDSQAFQFQHGAIKMQSEGRYRVNLPCFNSNMVRLKLLEKHIKTNQAEAVSIPTWCD